MKSKFKERRYRLVHFTVILIALAVLLRLPSFFEPNRYADEDIYLTIGQALKKGLVLYRDIHDNKPPAIYLTAALAQSVFGFRLILAIWHSINIILFVLLSSRLFSGRRRPIAVSGAAFTVLTTIPLLEGEIANGEIFMIMPLTAAMLLLWRYRRRLKSKAVFLFTGALFSLAFFFKATAALGFMAAVVFLIFNNLRSQKIAAWLRIVKNHALIALAIGFTFPIAASLLYFYSRGAGEPYLRSAVFQNIGYLSSWQGGSNSHLVLKGLILLLFLTGFYGLRRRVSPQLLFASVWFLFALFDALISGRPYPHYLLHPAVPAALLAGFIPPAKNRRWEMLVLAVLLAVSLFALTFTHFWYYPSLPYYKNFISYVSGRKTKAEFDWFFPGVKRNQLIAKYIRSHTLPDQHIFVWGTEPAIYAMSGRLPVGRFTTSYHIRDFDSAGAVLRRWESDPPPIVVTFDYETAEPWLFSWLNRRYAPAIKIENAQIYHYLPVR